MSAPFNFSIPRKSFFLLSTSLAILFVGCASNEEAQKPMSEPTSLLEFKPVSPTPSALKDRLDFGVGWTAYRGANVYATYKGFFDSSIVEANTQLALSDKLVNAKQLFAIPKSSFAVGYLVSFRDFKIVPNDSSTKNQQTALNAIGTMTFSDRESLISTFGFEKINSKTGGMAGVTGNQLFFPFAVTYRKDERVHPQMPTEGLGYFLKTNVEFSVFGEQYIKCSVRGQLDIPLNKLIASELDKFALSFKIFAGTETSLSNNSVPIVKRFFLENGSPVRGYGANAFGYNARGIPIGGDQMATGSSEVWMPFFHKDVRFYTFFDAGLMLGNGIETKGVKTSVGVGLTWDSPIGAVSISYGQALNKNAVNTQVIGIGLGINY
jgi:outer membrane protein assembly factor BamA